MRGLVYKEMALFFKSINIKLVFVAGAAVILLLYNMEIYAGLFASLMFSLTIAMQNTMGFVADEKSDWKRYQMSMPVNALLVVTSKYISVILTLVFSILGSIFFNIISGIFSGGFDITLCKLSVMLSVALPLFWNAICLPLTYWFDFRHAQIIRLFAIIPIIMLTKYMEDVQGGQPLMLTGNYYMLVIAFISVVLFFVSILASVAGYKHIR